MSITAIPLKYLNTIVHIQRRTITPDAVGDLTESWSDVLTSIKASVQPVKESEKLAAFRGVSSYMQGKEYTLDMKAYIPLQAGLTVPVPGDRLVDTEESKTYDIVGVLPFRASRQDVTAGHHYKLFLSLFRDVNS